MVALTAVSTYGFLGDRPVDPIYTIHRRGHSPIEIARDVLPAWAFILAGLIAWHRRPSNRTGPLMVAFGGAWLLHGFDFLPTSPWTTVGIWLGAGAGLFGVMLGLVLTAYLAGIKHSYDWDHIAAIDNSTRKFVAQHKDPVSVGFAFSLGHSSVVILAGVLVVGGAAMVGQFMEDGTTGNLVLGLIGGVFATVSKNNPAPPVGLDGLSHIAFRARLAGSLSCAS